MKRYIAVVGRSCSGKETIFKMAKEDKQDTIMVRPFTKPDDVHGMIASKGVLTSEGGATSHAGGRRPSRAGATSSTRGTSASASRSPSRTRAGS